MAYTFFPPNPPLLYSHSDSRTRFYVINRTLVTAQIYWIDDGSKQRLKSELKSGEGNFFNVSVTNPVFVEHVGKENLNFQFYAEYVDVFELTENGPRTWRHESEPWSGSQGFGVIDVSASLDVPVALPVSSEFASNSAALNLINCSSAWAEGYFGKGVKVAILDAGIAPHPLISGRIIGSFDAIVGAGTFSYDPNFCEDHGLGVASIISGCHSVANAEGLIAGVAPEAQLLNIRCTCKPRVDDTMQRDTEVMRRGIFWSVSAGAKVIMMPINGDGNFVDPGVLDALNYAKNNGVVSIIIGGNFNTMGGTRYALAAKERLAIAVGNYDLQRACPFPESNVPGDVIFPWVMANSSGVFPTHQMSAKLFVNGGTSFAGPYVAGLAALIVEKFPGISPDEVVSRITSGARLL